MGKILRNNGLTLALLAVFAFAMVGQTLTGWHEANQENEEHGEQAETLGEYLTSGHFWEATAENWESEFLQMAAYVLFTVFLFQKGSPESKDPDEEEAVDQDPRENIVPGTPWPVKRGGFWLWLYANSLSLAFVTLFLISFALHVRYGADAYNEEQIQHGQPTVSGLAYMATPRFWFESFQNWQSEFLSLAAMCYLAVYLRQQGSSESKPVAMPHDETE